MHKHDAAWMITGKTHIATVLGSTLCVTLNVAMMMRSSAAQQADCESILLPEYNNHTWVV
jgi:hypothetical protein